MTKVFFSFRALALCKSDFVSKSLLALNLKEMLNIFNGGIVTPTTY
jgi:hypothetical protein